MTSYHQLRARALEFIRQFASSGPVLVLAPVRAAADEVAIEACGAALIGLRRFGLRDLVAELAAPELNRRQLVPVGRFVREALAARVAHDALDELTYLRPVAAFPGFPRALTETLEELRLNAIDAETLRSSGGSGPDLAHLLEAYAQELSKRRFADHAARVTLATDAFSAGYNSLRQMAVVTIDLAPTNRLERGLISSVMSTARVTLELRLDATEAESRGSSLASLQRYLFSTEAVPPRDEDGSVAIFSTSGESLECVEIARAIHKAAADGVAFDQMAILLRSPERHQPLVLEVLRRAGIPWFSTLAARRPDVAGRAFVALLNCAAERLSASRFAEYLSLGQVPDEDEPPTPALWERMLVDAAVIGGLGRWQTRLAGLREELHRRHAAEPDEATRESIARRMDALDNLRRLALPVIERLAALPARALWGDWIEALAALADFCLRDPARVVELLEELEPMAEIGPVSLEEVLLVLGARLNSLVAPARESRFGRVWIGSIEESRGMTFRRVFVPGVNEGLFPRPAPEDPLIGEARRRALKIDLSDDTGLLRIAAACASERLTFSFSRLDLLTGRERVPSFYAFEAHRAAGGREMPVREFESRARSAATTVGSWPTTRTRGLHTNWPAPSDAADAIDDAEFDLATLAPLTQGSGQYLKDLPGRSVQSLRARWARWHKSWKSADGLYVEEVGNDALTPYRLSSRAWSPSALQQYARCPYRFALHGIYGLRPAERPSGIERMDPATRGEIFHAVQFEILSEMGRRSAAVNPENLAATLARLDVVLAEVAERFEADLAPAIPQIWRAEVQALRADLRGWLQQKARFEPDWTPLFCELSFGLRDPVGRDPRSLADAVEVEGGFRLRGSIDLVERHSSGALRVVDHKTGRVPDPLPQVVGGGETLQPVLYAMAAERMLGERPELGRLYYSTIAQNYRTIDVPMHDWARQRAGAALRVIDGAIESAFLPAAPRKDGCRCCEYLPVCGPYEEERIAGKDQTRLKSLKELRAWR